ncbi:VRR-NUC domain-containing protein [Nitratireductor rhodophyticola]|uniref:VRR-NUC domain-containing protein n=1 Tax=Nitratireductor rhodophyticola TaxID=2854036 RepID=UPI003BAA638D
MSATDLTRTLQKLASSMGARLFRQNTGMAWVGNNVERGYPGRVVRLGPNDVVIRNARPFHAGVKGMSDLGGWSPLVITGEMIGETVAVCTQVEVKFGRDRLSAEQSNWIDAVNSAGGRAGVARNEEDLKAILKIM